MKKTVKIARKRSQGRGAQSKIENRKIWRSKGGGSRPFSAWYGEVGGEVWNEMLPNFKRNLVAFRLEVEWASPRLQLPMVVPPGGKRGERMSAQTARTPKRPAKADKQEKCRREKRRLQNCMNVAETRKE